MLEPGREDGKLQNNIGRYRLRLKIAFHSSYNTVGNSPHSPPLLDPSPSSSAPHLPWGHTAGSTFEIVSLAVKISSQKCVLDSPSHSSSDCGVSSPNASVNFFPMVLGEREAGEMRRRRSGCALVGGVTGPVWRLNEIQREI